MKPRSLPLEPHVITAHRALPRTPVHAGWTRKVVALGMHASCIGLFGLTVVWPVASPMASGELAREFKPAFEALAAWWRGDAAAAR